MIINNEKEEVPFGNFIIDKPENEEVKEKTNFTGYDYMIKFNVPYENRVTYPCKAKILFQDLCSQVGLVAGNIDFPNAEYMILGNPFTNNENCRTVLSNLARLAGGFAQIGRDNKVYITNIADLVRGLTVNEVHEILISNLNNTLNKYLTKDNGKETADEIDGNTYFNIQKNLMYGEVNKVTLKLNENIDGEETSISDDNSITKNGLTELVIVGNDFLINEEERKKAIDEIWEKLRYLRYLPFKIEYYGFPHLDLGDPISISDTNDNKYRSYIFNNIFKFDGSFSGTLEADAITRVQKQYKPTSKIKEQFRKVELSVDKVNGKIEAVIEQQGETENKVHAIEMNIDGLTETIASNKEETDGTLKDLETKVTKTAEGIENNVTETLKSYSTTDETNTKINNAKSEAIDTAGTNTDNKLENYSTITEMNTQMQQTSKKFLQTVGETYTKKTDLETVEKNINTKYEQTNKDFLYQFDNITKTITNLSDATTEELDTISKYIRFIDGNIVLGQTGNQLTLNISNDRISFLQGSQEVAYFSNNKLYITDGEFLNSLKIGNFSFIPRSNGNLSFRKTGG